MTEKDGVIEEVADVEETEQVEEKVEEQPKDKSVEPSQFAKYRDAYLKHRLTGYEVNDEELNAALTFINGKADDTDSNLEEVFTQLRVRMRLDKRQEYADPSPMNGQRDRPRPRNPEEIGHEMYSRLKKNGRL